MRINFSPLLNHSCKINSSMKDSPICSAINFKGLAEDRVDFSNIKNEKEYFIKTLFNTSFSEGYENINDNFNVTRTNEGFGTITVKPSESGSSPEIAFFNKKDDLINFLDDNAIDYNMREGLKDSNNKDFTRITYNDELNDMMYVATYSEKKSKIINGYAIRLNGHSPLVELAQNEKNLQMILKYSKNIFSIGSEFEKEVTVDFDENYHVKKANNGSVSAELLQNGEIKKLNKK